MNGWIKLHRKLLDNPICKKMPYLALWVVLLLLANHDEEDSFIFNNERVFLKKGQLLTGRKKLKELTGIPESTIEDVLRYFEKSQQIRQQKTTKNRIITIVNWESFQTSDNKPTTNRQQTDTFKKLRSKEDTTTEQSSVGKEVSEIIFSFKEVNNAYSKWYNRLPQREATERLIQTHGFDRLKQVISLLPKTNKIQYFPVITTPIQLEDKWSALESQMIKKKVELQERKTNVAF